MKLFLYYLILIFVFSSCSKEKENVFLIGTNTWPGYEVFHYAKYKNEYKNSNIEIRNFFTATNVSNAFRNGIIDAATLTLDEVVLLAEKKVKFKIVLIIDYSNGADVIIGKEHINSMKDLEGKKVAVEHTALGAYFLSRAAVKSNIDLDRVQIIPRSENEHLNAFISENIDAVVTFEPVKSQILEHGGKIIFDSSKIPGEVVDVLIINEESYIKNKSIVKDIIQTWYKTMPKFKHLNIETIDYLKKKFDINDENANKMYDGLILVDRNQNLLHMKKDGLIYQNVKNLIHILKKSNLILDDNISIEEYITDEFI